MVAFIPAPALQFRTGVGAGYMERARALAPCDLYVFLVVTQGQSIKWKHVNSTQLFVGAELFLALTELLRGPIWSFSVVDKESCVCDVRLHVRPRARSALAAKTAPRLCGAEGPKQPAAAPCAGRGREWRSRCRPHARRRGGRAARNRPAACCRRRRPRASRRCRWRRGSPARGWPPAARPRRLNRAAP